MNNPPAFPQFPCMYGSDGRVLQDRKDQSNPGMTLRDYFAAKALQALIGNEKVHLHREAGETLQQFTARGAYMIADAMLKARETT